MRVTSFQFLILNSALILLAVINNHDEFIIAACHSGSRLHRPSIYIGASLRMWRFRAQMGGVSIKRFTSVADLPHEITPRVLHGLRWLTTSAEYHFSPLKLCLAIVPDVRMWKVTEKRIKPHRRNIIDVGQIRKIEFE